MQQDVNSILLFCNANTHTTKDDSNEVKMWDYVVCISFIVHYIVHYNLII